MSQKNCATFIFAVLWFLLTNFSSLFLLLQPEMIIMHIWNKISHLTITVTSLPHYRVNYKQVQFCKKNLHLLTHNEKDVTVIWISFANSDTCLFIFFREMTSN